MYLLLTSINASNDKNYNCYILKNSIFILILVYIKLSALIFIKRHKNYSLRRNLNWKKYLVFIE